MYECNLFVSAWIHSCLVDICNLHELEHYEYWHRKCGQMWTEFFYRLTASRHTRFDKLKTTLLQESGESNVQLLIRVLLEQFFPHSVGKPTGEYLSERDTKERNNWENYIMRAFTVWMLKVAVLILTLSWVGHVVFVWEVRNAGWKISRQETT